MGRAKRCSVVLLVVFGVLGTVSCRRHHTKPKPESMPWFPAHFITPPDQSTILLSRPGHIYPPRDSNTKLQNSTKGLHVDQTIGIIGRHQSTLQAAYGPFFVAENVMPLTNISNDNELNRFTVKTELLTTVLPVHDPTVRVLFRWEKEVDFSNGAADMTMGQEPLPCAKLVVFYDGQELSSACRMQGGVLACVAKLPIPPEWWGTMGESDAIQAYYSVFQVAENAPCLPDNHNAIPPRDGEPGNTATSPQYFIGEVKMGSSDEMFIINREDHYVWIHTPTAEFGSNAKFQIPVSILSNFTAAGCVIRAKARQGLQVIAVHTVDTQEWSISSRVNPKGSLAMVTVLRREEADISYYGFASSPEDSSRQGSDGISIAFTVEFEVLNGTDGARPINWRIDYEEEMHTMQVRTTVEVRPHSTHSLVAITKDGNIVNTAALNGVRVNKPMTVLAASYAGQVLDVTGKAQCRSTDTTVVQVDKHCRRVYVDGTETSGSLSVQIQVSYEGQTTYKLVSLWMPEFPLEVVLDDNKLSIIKGWKIPSESSDRMTRGAEMLDLNEEKKQSSKGKCRLRYQQSGVQVYTRFYAPHANTGQTGRKVYLFGEDLRHRITHLVVDQLATDDTSIAVVKNGQVYADGEYAGITAVKVVAPYGMDSLGQALVTVGTDKVTVEDLHVAMVTGMSMKIHPSRSERSNVMVAKVRGRDQIVAQNQEIILDGLMTFSDGSSANLQNMRHRDFTPDITTLNPEILSESPLTTPHHPTLIALGEGVTSVMLQVKIPEACQKWKNNNVVAFDLMQVNVSFSGGNHLNEDGQETRRNGRLSLTPTVGHVDYGVTLPDYDPSEEDQQGGRGGKGRNGKKGTNVISSIPIDIDISDLYPRYTNHKTDDEDDFGGDQVDFEDKRLDLNFFNKQDEELSPLEIGMYVLLGVFCIAILAFMINCVLFMARYRKSKRVPGVGASTYPQNWVLFGPDDHMPAPVSSPEEMVPLQNCPGENSGSPEECTCTESEVSVERHSNGDCGMHAIQGQGSNGTLPCASKIYGNENCDCCNGVCECEMDTAMHDEKSEDDEDDDVDSDRGSVSICSSESRENMEVKTPAADSCNTDSGLDSVVTHTNHLSDDCVESDTNTAVPSVAIAPEEPSTSTEATEDLEEPSSELRITLNPTAGVEDCSIETPQDEIGFGELLDYLSELQESCA